MFFDELSTLKLITGAAAGACSVFGFSSSSPPPNNVDGGVAYRTISEWEDIFFNAPYYPTVVVEEDLLEGGGLTEGQEYLLSQINDGFKRIKSLDQLSKEMPYLLTKCYELLIKIRG